MTTAYARRTRLARAFARIGLPAWFVTIDVVWRLFDPATFAIDARHYQRAANAWLAGMDPWTVTEQGVPYAAGPHTLLFYAPTSVLPVWLASLLWTLAGLGASIWLVRRLALPWWWLAFPPLVHGAWNGNPQTLALAALVAGGTWLAAAAVGLKLYAAVALVFQPRRLILVGVALAAALPILPIGFYLESGGNTAAHLSTAWNGSAWRVPVLLVPTVVALWVLRDRGAEWLAIPAAWPGTQLYYNAMAMPALVGRPWVAAAMAVPIATAPAIATIALALVTLREQRRAGARPATNTPAPPAHRQSDAAASGSVSPSS